MTAFSPDPNEPSFVLRSAAYLVRSERTGREGFVHELEQAVWATNPNLPLASVRTLQEIYDALAGADVVHARHARPSPARWRSSSAWPGSTA